ncbi:MAG: N-acetylglucosamine-6-phosphate deacetylase [Puniceicoccales bacterium]
MNPREPLSIELFEPETGSLSGIPLTGTREPLKIHFENRTITGIEPLPERGSEPLPTIAPSLVDLQVNGYGGIDFQRLEQLSDPADSLTTAARALRRDGCGRVLLTLITDEWPRLLDRARLIHSILAADPNLGRLFFGLHLEGPFLSSNPGYSGAHSPTALCDPSEEKIHELREAIPDLPLLITLAPERKNGVNAVRAAVNAGMRVSIGHSDITPEILQQSADAGASGITHLANACPQELDRHDNILWRVLDGPAMTTGLIPDTHHVSPPLFRLLHRTIPSHILYWTTDAMAGSGANPGLYSIGPLEIEVGKDGIARMPGSLKFAGSALRPIQGIQRGASMLGTDIQSVWPYFSTQPMQYMRHPWGLDVGAPASFCLMDAPLP